jgi:hypothetical protein
MKLIMYILRLISGGIQDFKIGGGHKKIARRGERRENFWGISCEKSRFYAKKLYLKKNIIIHTISQNISIL